MRKNQHEPMSAREVASRLGIDLRTVQRQARNGKLPATKLPGVTGSFVFDRSEIEALALERAS